MDILHITLRSLGHAVRQFAARFSDSEHSQRFGIVSSSYIAYDQWPDAARQHMR